MITANPEHVKRQSASDPRIPLSIEDAWRRMRLASGARSPQEIIGATTATHIVLQEFRPLAASLEWDLSRLHWQQAGTLPFAENEVPFLVNNTGRLSEDAATLLFHNCRESPLRVPIVVLELGAGCGLFARLFLSAFEALCSQEGADYFGRLTYIVSDGSPRSVADWSLRGVFAGYEQRVVPLTCRADDPRELDEALSTCVSRGPSVRAVLCNYVLDVLPSRVVRRTAGAIEEMHIRTLLAADAAVLREYTQHTSAELQLLADSTDPADRAQLIPLTPLFDVEVAFRPVQGPEPYLEEALSAAGEMDHVLVNTGALECLAVVRNVLEDSGFVLLNDYGPTDSRESPDYCGTQRFGRTTAHAINFPVFDRLASGTWTVVVPEGDGQRSIHSRLLISSDMPRTRSAFLNRFSGDAQQHFETPLADARDHATAGRKSQALESFRTAVARSPRDWRVLGEAAEFTGLDLRDFSAGAELARAALEMNPWYSTWLWNVLGDCLYCLERQLDAHEAYLQAQRINPRDARTLLNLSYTWAYLGNHEEALSAIGTGLACDSGPYRARLLEKQVAILASGDVRRSAEYDRLVLAASRMRPNLARAVTAQATT